MTAGDILSSFNVATGWPNDCAYDGESIWHVNETPDTIVEFDKLGNALSSFAASSGTPTGLTHMDDHIWHGNTSTQIIYQATKAGSYVSSFANGGANNQGLAHDGANLWNSDTGSGVDDIIEMSEAGSVLSSFAAPNSVQFGITWIHEEGELAMVDRTQKDVYFTNTTGSIQSSFVITNTQANGLAFEGPMFWHADSGTDEMYELEGPARVDGDILSSFSNLATSTKDIAQNGEFLWLSADGVHDILKIDKAGKIVSSFNAPHTFPYGISHDGTNFWHADLDADDIYEVNESGTIQSSFVADDSQPTGVTRKGAAGNIWHSKRGRGSVDERTITGTSVSSFDNGIDPFGLAWQADVLWVCDNVDKIYNCNAAGTIASSWLSPGAESVGIEFEDAGDSVNQHVWVTDEGLDMTFRHFVTFDADAEPPSPSTFKPKVIVIS